MKNKFSIAITLAVVLAMFLTSLALADTTPTISSDLLDYPPGATVNLFGAGWQPGESVHIFVNDSAGSSWSRNADVVAADDGTFTDTFQLPDWFVAVYSVTATGTTSGTARTSFTDAVNVNTFVPSGTNSCSTTGQTSFSLGNVVCAKATGLGSDTFQIKWFNPSNMLKDTSANNTVGNLEDTFTPDSPGTWTLKVVRVSDGMVAGTNTFTVTAPTDTTAPTASPTQSPAANGAGWNNTDVTVNWNWSDNAGGSGIDNANCTTSSLSSGEGTLILSATCKDLAGNTGNASYIVKVDKTKPVITGNRLEAANANGWNNTNVVVYFSCTDSGGSGIALNNVAGATLSGEGANQSVTNVGTCTDNAGNVADSATVNSISIDKTAPTSSASASPAPNGAGWNNTDVTVSFSGTDGLSGIDTCSAAVVLNTDGADQSASGTCTDKAGNVSGYATASDINIDKTKPTISAAATTSPNGAGWYNTNVTVKFSCNDAGSGIPANACPADQVLSAEGTGISSTAQTVTDTAGNTSDASNVITVNIDKTAPTISASISPAASNTGWYNLTTGAPTVTFGCNDTGGSGLAGSCPSAVTLGEGEDQSVSGGPVSDLAGNVSNVATISNIDVDLIAPGITITTPPAGASYLLNQPVAANYSCADATSGIATCAGPVASGSNIDTAGTGPRDFTVNASDEAGNTNSATNSYSVAFKLCVLYDQTKSHKSGSTVPLKLQLCDFNGVNYSSAAITVKAISVTKMDNNASGTLDDSGAANSPDMNFRYDATLGGTGGYIFNLSTKGLTTGTWKVTFTVNGASNTSYFVKFDVK